ncbi:MAG: V-type ATP synthase subunit F [Bacillota bacterium]
MKSIVLTDSKETIIGLRLAGIKGELIDDSDKLLDLIDNLIQDENIGIILITQNLFNKYNEKIMDKKLSSSETLIMEIPGFDEDIKTGKLTDYISESIGMDLD